MRVLLLSNNDIGLYKFRKELIVALKEEKHDVFFCVPDGPCVDTIKELGCEFIPCDLIDRHGRNPFKDLQLINFYKKTLKVLKPDIVFTYTIKPNVYGGIACSKLKIPFVSNVTGLGTSIENGGFTKRVSLFLYKIGMKKAKKVFFQNEENEAFLLKNKIIKCPYDLLPGSGVNLSQYKYMPLPDDGLLHFAFVARIMKEKGIEQYLDAAIYIKEKYPQTRFHVCGYCEQNYEERIKELVEKEIVIYHGLVDDMSNIYRIVCCVVHPTFYPEGLSNVLLESCASGRPIITTDRSGCREVVDNGLTGFIVKQKDSLDLINKIETFISLDKNTRAKMGIAARKKVEQEFDRRIVVDKYLKEIESVVELNELQKDL